MKGPSLLGCDDAESLELHTNMHGVISKKTDFIFRKL